MCTNPQVALCLGPGAGGRGSGVGGRGRGIGDGVPWPLAPDPWPRFCAAGAMGVFEARRVAGESRRRTQSNREAGGGRGRRPWP
jgi:hypothetical protein